MLAENVTRKTWHERSIPPDRCPPLQRDSQPSRERRDRGDYAPMSGSRTIREQRRTSQSTFRMKQVPQLLMLYMQSSLLFPLPYAFSLAPFLFTFVNFIYIWRVFTLDTSLFSHLHSQPLHIS